MSIEELDMIIDWCRKKIDQERSRPYGMRQKALDGYEIAMKAVMSYLHSLKNANNEQIQVMTSEIIELANIIAERPCDSEDCAPCIRMGRRCNDYLKAERAIEAGYRKQSEGEWISVEERLPDGSGKFLVVDEEGYMTTATWYPNHGWFMAVCNGTPVTHWMPLPEPPVTKGA